MGYNAPIVALTAFADDINRKECIESGMSDFMAKPIKRPALKHVLKTYCPPPAIQEVDEGASVSSPKIVPKEEDKKGKDVGVVEGYPFGSGKFLAADDLKGTATAESPLVTPGSEIPLLKKEGSLAGSE